MNYTNKYLTAWLVILMSSNHAFSQANTSLSNLVSTSINRALEPNANNTLDLGSSTYSWKNLYLDGAIVLNDYTFINNNGQSFFVGSWSGIDNTGMHNTGLGNFLLEHTTGVGNTASGYSSLTFTTAGNYNTANGYNSLYHNSIGDSNAAYGYNSLFSNISGSGYGNTAAGASALYTNTGFGNTATGNQALYSGDLLGYNTGNGYQALYSGENDYNTANGKRALYKNQGSYNTANGTDALYNNKGNYNTVNGYRALYSNTSGIKNTANGNNALYFNTTGSYNTANGHQALYSNTSGYENIANGYGALLNNTAGYFNVAFGAAALQSNTTGICNTSIGYRAGLTIDSSTFCTFTGYGADQSSSDSLYNSTAIGNASIITASDQVRIGNTTVTSIGGYEPWTDLSDGRFKKEIRENVQGLAFINKLKPVTYHLDVTGLRKFLGEDKTGKEGLKEFTESAEHNALIEEGIKKKEQIVYTGFIAQEIEAAAKELDYDFSGVDVPSNENSLYGLRYSQFVGPLVKAVQELDENQKLEVAIRKSEVNEVKKEIEDLKSRIASLQSSIDH